jgi:pyridoxal/pyridoxine/pyridoxamine kinase
MKFSIGRPHNKMCTPSLHSQSWRVVSLATTELCSHMAKQALEKLTQ